MMASAELGLHASGTLGSQHHVAHVQAGAQLNGTVSAVPSPSDAAEASSDSDSQAGSPEPSRAAALQQVGAFKAHAA